MSERANPIIAITHAAFSEERRQSLNALVSRLRTECTDIPHVIACDHDRKGSLFCWRQAMDLALLDPEVTHIIWLPDDAIVCDDFGRMLRACIAARPSDVFDCYVNHPLGEEVQTCWYTTADGGFVGMGGVMPRELLEAHLRWRDDMQLGDYPNDAGVNLWAIHTGRRIYKTAWTLVDHNAELESLDGNDDHEFRKGLRPVDQARHGVREDVMNFLGRTFAAPEAHMPGMATSVTELPNTWKGNHWDLVKRLPPKHWNLDAMYRVARHGDSLETPSVYILTPTYRMPQELLEKTRASVTQVREALGKAGIPTGYLELRGDALVCRMRQRGCNIMLQSGCSHLLWWDGDIECLTPECVKDMIETGHGVIAGAVPFKNDSKAVVCNLYPDDVLSLRSGGTLTIEGGCVPVKEAGSGFMLIRRDALYRMQTAHPELLHFSLSKSDFGEPLWALFDTKVIDQVYLSEDYYFCHLWRALGELVYVYEPARFKHYGTHGFEGSLREQYGLQSAEPG